MKCFHQGSQQFSVELEIETTSWPFGAPRVPDPVGKKGLNLLAEMIDREYQKEIGLLLYARAGWTMFGI